MLALRSGAIGFSEPLQSYHEVRAIKHPDQEDSAAKSADGKIDTRHGSICRNVWI
jgi:hypothetical protein